MKVCTDCKQNKTLNDYHKSKRDGYASKCKFCMNKIRKDEYNKKKLIVKTVIIDPLQSKLCTVCLNEKSLSCFYIHKTKGTIRAECKSCASEWRKANYKKNRSRVIKQTGKSK